MVSVIGSLLSGAFRMGTPFIFGGLAATFSDRVGIINLGLEGIMLIGAFFGYIGIYLTGSILTGLLFAILAGAIMGLVLAVMTVSLKANHLVVGIGINVFAAGITSILLEIICNVRGTSPAIEGVPTLRIAALQDIPVIGAVFGNQSPFVWAAIIIAVFAWFFIFRTRQGLRIRAMGENLEAASATGIPVKLLQYIFVIVSGILAALGGAYLSMGSTNLFNDSLISGRGFIALITNIIGNWNPLGIIGAGLFFGLAQALQLQIYSEVIPPQFLQCIPYLVTLLAVCGVVRRVRAPSAAGKQYESNL